jgi:Domain of unknown function DUF29
MTTPDYDTDFYAWTQVQAAALRQKDVAALDLDNLAEEIESLGKRDRRTVQGHLKVLLLHLLKWTYQPQRRGASWQRNIHNARDTLDPTLNDSPSLREKLPEALAWAYPRARRQAHEQTGLPLATFPEGCPWAVTQVLDEYYWPEDQP